MSASTLKSWSGLSYPALVTEVVSLFVGPEEISRAALEAMVAKAYSVFDDSEVCKVRGIDQGLMVAELFHGPTLTFKDYALSLVGRMYDYFLAKREKHMTIVVGE